MNNILPKLTAIFRDAFDDELLTLTADITSNEIDGWDSLAQITLMTAVESEFNVKFDMNDLMNVNSVGDIVELLKFKLQ